MLEKSHEYRRRADEVLELMRGESDPAVRQAYVEIAEAWLRLALGALEIAAPPDAAPGTVS